MRRPTGPLPVVGLAFLSTCVALVLWYPLLRIGSLPSINYNEGWNAYRQSMTVAGRPLYAAPPSLWITNYPFLSFHLVGLLGAAIGNMVLAGRLVSLAALFAVAALSGGIVHAISGSRRGGAFAALCLLLWICTFTPERRAMDDPGLLAAAIAASGLLAYVKAPGRTPWLILSALAFAAGLFTKQDIIALPLGVGIGLLARRRWAALAIWGGVGTAVAGLLLWLTFRLDGPRFFANLLWPRAYLAGHLVENLFQYVLRFGAPLAVCTTILVRERRICQRDLLLILLLCTNVVSVAFSGGDGVARNVFYPALIALAVACGVVVGSAEPSAGGAFRRHRRLGILIVPVLAGAVFVPFQLAKDVAAWRDLPSVATAARRTIAVIRSTRGPALCETILLCDEAGKPIDYDPFFVRDQLAIGRYRPSAVLAMLASRRYAAIEIDGPWSATRSSAPEHRRRFTSAFMRTLLSDYRMVSATGPYAVFEPRH